MSPLKGVPLDPRRRTGLRPYANRAQRLPSVTTIIGVLDKPGLAWAAARETATYAVLHHPEWNFLDPDKAIDMLYRHHRGLWDGRAAMGNLVHAVNEAWTWGETVEIGDLIVEMLTGKRPPRIWQGHENEVAQEASGYVDGLEAFWNDFGPETIATEEVVRCPTGANSYIGQRDWTAVIDGKRWQLDLKTTAEQDSEKGHYLDSWRLQHAAYRHAEELVIYEDGKEVDTAMNYPVDHCGIVHLRGSGHYELLEVQAGASEFARFCQARCVWSWVNKEAKTPPAHTVAPPVREREVVA